jgi:hypothetical protein
VRDIRREGDGGHYFAYATVKNTSMAAKLHNCYCEIVELRNDAGEVILRQFPLGPEGQEPTESGSRFSLDQGAKKDILLFEIDQLKGNAFYIRAATEKINLGFGVYTARVHGYGDSGQPDEITVRVDCRALTFELVI